MILAIGDPAPAFRMSASGGRTVDSAELAGKPYVLYFYPKADTPGCTKQACAFQESMPRLDTLGIAVIGVSRDPMKAIDAFARKHDLAFPLASDSGDVSEDYGVWVEKAMYGRKYMGMERATFLVGADGRIVRIWHQVKVPGHAKEVMEAVGAL